MSKLHEVLNIPDYGRKATIGSLDKVDKELSKEIPELNLNKVPDFELDFMILCADDTNDLKDKCLGLRYIKYDSMLWVALPKKHGTNEEEVFNDECREMMRQNNVTVVNEVKLNDEWQALQVRPFVRVM